MAINVGVWDNGFYPTLSVETRLLPSGNPFKYHAEVLSSQPMKQ